MYATFDRHSPVDLGTEVLSLSWKGDSRQGWLAAGNSRKTVGVTYTELKDWEGEDSCETDSTAAPEVSLERQGMRRNFNFREHSAEVYTARELSVCVCVTERYLCENSYLAS
jgi:hypothetical protein